MPKTPADIKPAARRIAAIIAEYPLRYRAMVEEVKSVATVFYAGATGIMPGDPDPGRMSHEAAIDAAERLLVVSRIFRIFGAAADPVKRFGW
jgi:hypothetical protein